ncbi:MAG: hypothetical protein FJ217_15080 [Ignavibacteria bacterium]|nr:hypothetical protein [Ignavibacteria bacterium]
MPFLATTFWGEQDLIRGHAYYFPIFLVPEGKNVKKGQEHQLELQATSLEQKPTTNLSADVRAYLAKLGIKNVETNVQRASVIWMHALAIGYSPAYLKENADGIRQDWPRIPLPKSAEMLERSAALGRKIASLLDTENDVRGVTSGTVTPEMKHIAVIESVERKQLRERSEDLALTAGWGHAGKDGVTMPGKGKIVRREYTKLELAAIQSGAKVRGLTLKKALEHLGESTCDVYLNDVAFWGNIPEKVWEYTIGGYQVIKKWLSYRERGLLGRPLTSDEAREVMNMARRITGIILMQPALDANYRKVKAAAYEWGEAESSAKTPKKGNR